MAYYNLVGDPYEDMTNITILELEGTIAVEGSGISSDQFLKPLKIKKVNIRSLENPNFTKIINTSKDIWKIKMTRIVEEDLTLAIIRGNFNSKWAC